MCLILRFVAPPNPDYPWHPTLTAKWDHLSTTEDHYEVVFVGDSTVFQGIDPFIVSDELTALGCPASVYNLGVLGMTKLEYDETMHRLEDIPGGRPEVVVTVNALPLLVGLAQDFSVRHRSYLDARRARETIEYMQGLPTEFNMGRDNQLDLLAAFVVNQVPQGAIHQQIFREASGRDEERLVGTQLGYRPWDEFWEEAGPDGPANLHATIEVLVEDGRWDQRWAEETPDPAEVERWMSTLDEHDEHTPSGSLGVHMLVPTIFDAAMTSAVTDTWRDRRPDIPIINLVDRSLVGDYDDPDFFVDYIHLSELGGAAVSRAAAAQLCPIVRDRLDR